MVVGQRNKLMKKIVIINFFLFFLILISLELISKSLKLSGLMGIQNGLIYNKNDINFFYPNVEGIIFDEKIYTDKHGFRVPTKDFDYKGNKNILILGDSVAFGNGVKEEKTFVGLLRNYIKDYNLYNSSVPGYQIKDQIYLINHINTIGNIERIIYFFTLNDIYGDSHIKKPNDKFVKESDFSLKKINLFNSINSFLRNKSYLYMFIKGLSTDPSKRWFLNIFKRYEQDDLSEIRKNFTILKKISDESDSKLLIILLPYEYQTRRCTKEILLPQFKLKKAIKDTNIDFKDFTNILCEQKKPKKYFYKYDPMHLSKKGHMLIFEALKNEISF